MEEIVVEIGVILVWNEIGATIRVFVVGTQ